MLHLLLAATLLSNPLLEPSTLPFGAPRFDRIRDGDYLPAIRYAIAEQRRLVEAIANDPAPPTFQNTFVPLERSGRLLANVLNTFSAVAQANTDPVLQETEDVTAPELASHEDEMYLNPKLFARVRTIYGRLGSLHLDPESRQLVKVDYEQFVRAGAALPPAQKAKLDAIDRHISTLEAAFRRKLLAATSAGALHLTDRAQLSGLSASAVAAAAQAAADRNVRGWLIPLQNTTQQPALASLDDRSVRQALFEHSWTRAEKNDANDTRSTIAQIAALRAERARILGYPDYAAYALTDQMAQTPQAVQSFLKVLIPATRAKAAAERAELQAAAGASGMHATLQPWDWEYYAQRVERKTYGLDEREIRPYFELNNVLENGLFYAANRLYGITFKERHDIPVYQPDVRVFEVYDNDGSPLALMYFDFFKRDNKSGGAWMANFVDQSKLFGTKPVVYNVENFTKPAPGQPALLSVDDVHGMFHEFGHALNGFFADQEYASLSGASTARDFVEFPSQFNEHWALYPAVLRHYAFNYYTHRPMPQQLIAKIERASSFGQGYAFGEALAADELDMAWHTLSAGVRVADVDAFQARALHAAGTDFPDVPPRYSSSYFAHIWSSGYAAGYYAYAWSEMLDDDAYAWFMEHGGLTRANGRRFRDLILSRGHSEDYGPMFRAFYGRDPDVRPLLRDRGLTEGN
jgi:peptidyl-dipeptidase Dcp